MRVQLRPQVHEVLPARVPQAQISRPATVIVLRQALAPVKPEVESFEQFPELAVIIARIPFVIAEPKEVDTYSVFPEGGTEPEPAPPGRIDFTGERSCRRHAF